MPSFRENVRRIEPYVPGKPVEEVAREFGVEDIVKLASNECPLPPFPEVMSRIAAVAGDLNRYPDTGRYELRMTLATKLGVPPECLWFGAGSTEILVMSTLAVAGVGDRVVYGWPSFVIYQIATRLSGAEAAEVPLDGDQRYDLAAIASAIDGQTRAVFICNPNNPTGTVLPGEAVESFIESVPTEVLVVIDEAYHEYVTAPDYKSMLPLGLTRPNVLVTRTFSKIYGLAGLRVGYAVGHPDTLLELRKAQPPFTVNTVAQVAAVEALRHPGRLAERAAANSNGRDELATGFAARGIQFIPSQANFVWAQLGGDAGVMAERLMKRGVIVRPFFGGWTRVSVGTPEENARLLSSLDAEQVGA